MASGRDRFYFPPPQSIDQGSIADRANRVAEGLATSGDLDGIKEDVDAVSGIANNAQNTAVEAIAAANAANLTVQQLITGGIRTIYTTNFVYIPPPNLLTLGVIVIGGGECPGGGDYPNNIRPYPVSGGYAALMDVPAANLPASISGVIGAGFPRASSPTGVNVTSFGSILSSPLDGTGSVVSAAGDVKTNSVPIGGRIRQPGGGTPLAIGGSAGGGSTPGGTGDNAPTTGVRLALGGGGGGGGGGNGQGDYNNLVAGSPGGPGGFPGGPGGCGGHNYGVLQTGGPGAPGLIALIEVFKS